MYLMLNDLAAAARDSKKPSRANLDAQYTSEAGQPIIKILLNYYFI